MKTKFILDAHRADLSGSTIEIIGKAPLHRPYVRIEIADKGSDVATMCMFIEDKELELLAVNILKALKSKRLKDEV